ncbi:MAG: hypothetical protein ACOYBL_01200 [Lachnospiraceae bacterium]
MKKMKLLALLLAVSMTFSLTACGSSEEAPEEPAEEAVEEEEADEEDAEVEEPEEEIPTAEEAAAEFSRGVIEDNVYTSEFGGWTFTAPDGYRFYEDSEIATVYGLSEDMLGIEAADSVVYDMYCVDANGNNVSVNYENLSGVYGTLLDEKSYLELSQSGLKTAFEGIEGMSITSIESGTVDIAGTTMDCINLELSVEEVPFYETLVVKKVEGYMAICTVSAFSTEEVTTLLAGLANL